MCELCKEEAKPPASYSISATSKLRNHVQKYHVATANAIAASELQEPPGKKIKLSTDNIFAIMMGSAAAIKKDAGTSLATETGTRPCSGVSTCRKAFDD